MKRKQDSVRYVIWIVIVISFSLFACEISDMASPASSPAPPEPSQTPFPTYTPYPTLTPYPTFTPYPTIRTAQISEERYFEEFEGGVSCFDPFTNENAIAKEENGMLGVNILHHDQSLWLVCQNQTFSDFTMEVEVRTLEDGEGAFYYGVVLRETGGQYYNFIISTSIDGMPVYCVSYVGTNAYVPLTNSTFDPSHCWARVPSNIYNDEMNTLKVSTSGEILEFYVNDDILFTTRDNLLSAGRIGFIIGTYTQEKVTVAYDNLRGTVP